MWHYWQVKNCVYHTCILCGQGLTKSLANDMKHTVMHFNTGNSVSEHALLKFVKPSLIKSKHCTAVCSCETLQKGAAGSGFCNLWQVICHAASHCTAQYVLPTDSPYLPFAPGIVGSRNPPNCCLASWFQALKSQCFDLFGCRPPFLNKLKTRLYLGTSSARKDALKVFQD